MYINEVYYFGAACHRRSLGRGIAVDRPENWIKWDKIILKRNKENWIPTPSILKWETQPPGPSRHPALSYRPSSLHLPSATWHVLCNTARYYLVFWQLSATRASSFSASLPLRPFLPPSQVDMCPRIRKNLLKTKHSLFGQRPEIPPRKWLHFGDPPMGNNLFPFDFVNNPVWAAHFGRHASFFTVFRCIDDKSCRT